jgi:hypothetical protein
MIYCDKRTIFHLRLTIQQDVSFNILYHPWDACTETDKLSFSNRWDQNLALIKSTNLQTDMFDRYQDWEWWLCWSCCHHGNGSQYWGMICWTIRSVSAALPGEGTEDRQRINTTVDKCEQKPGTYSMTYSIIKVHVTRWEQERCCLLSDN